MDVIIKVPVSEQIDLCGDEFLDEHNWDIMIDLNGDSSYVNCVINDKPNCLIKKSDIIKLASIIQSQE